MRFVIALCLLVLSYGVPQSQTVELPSVKETSIVRVVSDMEIIAERRDPVDRTFPYFLRIVRLPSDGECSGTPRSCPTEIVYIAISGRGEGPDRFLYRLPKAHGWELYGWDYLPQQELPEEFVVFTMKKKVVASDTTRGWWAYEFYEIKVNTWSATMRKIP